MKPRLVTMDAFRVVGLEGFFASGPSPQIPALWERFAPRIPTIPGREGTECYGLSQGEVPGPDGRPSLWYMPAVRVSGEAATPAGLRSVVVPAGTYAVFTHESHISQIGATFDAILREWLPAAGLAPGSSPGYERYDERWDGRTGTGPVDIYVPVHPVKPRASRP